MKHLIAPSLLSANFLDLRKEMEMINKSDADWLDCGASMYILLRG